VRLCSQARFANLGRFGGSACNAVSPRAVRSGRGRCLRRPLAGDAPEPPGVPFYASTRRRSVKRHGEGDPVTPRPSLALAHGRAPTRALLDHARAFAPGHVG
jgi:hypothetical protein